MSIEKFEDYLKAYDGWGAYGPDFTLTRHGAQFILLALEELAGKVDELSEGFSSHTGQFVGQYVTQSNDQRLPVGTTAEDEEGASWEKINDPEDPDDQPWQVRDAGKRDFEVSDVYAAEFAKARITFVPNA